MSKKSKIKGTTRRLVVSDTKAYDISAINYNGADMISIRQLYATKKDSEYRPARQGMTFPKSEIGEKLLKRALKMLLSDETVYAEIEKKDKDE